MKKQILSIIALLSFAPSSHATLQESAPYVVGFAFISSCAATIYHHGDIPRLERELNREETRLEQFCRSESTITSLQIARNATDALTLEQRAPLFGRVAELENLAALGPQDWQDKIQAPKGQLVHRKEKRKQFLLYSVISAGSAAALCLFPK